MKSGPQATKRLASGEYGLQNRHRIGLPWGANSPLQVRVSIAWPIRPVSRGVAKAAGAWMRRYGNPARSAGAGAGRFARNSLSHTDRRPRPSVARSAYRRRPFRSARAVAVLCEGYRQPSSINGLAGSLHMSTSSLHRSSKRRRRFSAAVVPETAALARNVVADNDRRSGSQNRRAPRRLRKPVAVQPLIQTPVRYANALGDRIGQGLHQR